ncbi:MAG: hypothetical protein MnENMB40S_13400 [Rhizobiaceae bacterium MnEN-MB40S]|nr:MAG: hypothetical protein MnENMB40S_13400 [Rhizobiaceae bacterium MnEN-MB40S]
MKALQRQMAFIEASTATKTAGDCKRALERSIDHKFDRPVKYTQNAIAVRPALKSRPVARVFVKDRQAGYLIYQARGGIRTPKGKSLVVPVNARCNRYGNLSRNYLKNQLAKPNVFSGKVNSVAGVYQRMKSGHMKLLVAFEPQARYRKRWNPDSIVRRTASRSMPIHYRMQLRAAFRQIF